MVLKVFWKYIIFFIGNKYEVFFLFIASFFIMMSAKVTPVIYEPHEGGIFNPIFDTWEIFPLSFFDYFLWILVFVGLRSVIGYFAKKIYVGGLIEKNISIKNFIGITLFLTLAWLPYLFTFYPGTTFQDEIYAMRNPFATSNQPLFYNYLLKFIWDCGKFFGDETLGFGIFNIIKILFMAGSISYMLLFLYKRGISKYFLMVFALIFAFLPIFPNYAISIVKDSTFSVFLLLLTLFLYNYKEDYKQLFKKNIRYVCFCFYL